MSTTTTTPGRGVTCEITIDAAAIASAVGAATKGIAREPGDVYAFDPEEAAEGDAAADARASARERGRGEGSACARGSNGREATTSETESVVMPEEARARRSFEGETSRGAKAKTPRAAETTARTTPPAKKPREGSMDEPYARYEELFGAKELFAKSSSRARSAQADMYIQDYMERNVYGYAHASVKRKTRGGRGHRRGRREVTMERRVVGVGRPEDALDFDDDEEPKCARRHEPLQALPPSFTVARGDKVPDGELLLKPTWMQRRAHPAANDANMKGLEVRTLKVKDSSTKKTQVGKQSEPKGLMTVADVAHRARMEASPLRKRFKDGAKTKLTETKSSPLRAPSLMGNLKMPGTIFDGDDFMYENANFWETINDDLQLEHPEGLDVLDEGARTRSPSPGFASDDTGSPKPTNKQNTVDRRLRALEKRLLRGDFHKQSPMSERRLANRSIPSREGNANANQRPKSKTIDDTAHNNDGEHKKRSVSGGSDGHQNATSLPEASVQAEMQSLKDTILALQRRQDEYEVERARHKKYLHDLSRMHQEHTKSLESIIDAYQVRLQTMSPQSPRARDRIMPTARNTGTPRTAPRLEQRGYDELSGDHHAGLSDRFDRSMRARGPFSEPRHDTNRYHDYDAVVGRERQINREQAARHYEMIAELATECSNRHNRWNL